MPEDIEKQNLSAGEGQDNDQAGEGQADDQNDSATDTGNEDEGNGEGTKDGGKADDTDKGDDAGGGKTKKDAKAPEGSQKDDEDDGAEPEQRKRMSTIDFIIQRKQKKLSKIAKSKDDNDTADDKDTEVNEDDEIAPEDEALITKVVAKKFAPIIDKSIAADDNQEVNDFLTANPDFKPFEKKVRRYMQSPSRRSLPIKSIFYEVAGDKLIKIGAERQRLADQKAKDSHTGGGSGRAEEGSKSDWELPKEEFEAKQERIRQGRK